MSPGGQRATEIDLFFLFLVRTTALNLEAHTYIQAAIIRRTFDISWRGKDRLICSHVSLPRSRNTDVDISRSIDQIYVPLYRSTSNDRLTRNYFPTLVLLPVLFFPCLHPFQINIRVQRA